MSEVEMGWSREACSLLLLGIVTSGCGVRVSVLSQAAITGSVVDANFRSLAACSYTKLDASQGTGIKKLELENSIVLALESGDVRIWEVTFTPESNARTQVDYSPVHTFWGPQSTSIHQILSDVRSCSGGSL